MSSPSMGRLLISHITLRGPEVRQLYRCIAGVPGISYEDLVRLTAAPINAGDPFGLQEAALREALNFLLVARLVEQHGTARRRATFHPTSAATMVPFSLLLMNRIAEHPDERQRVIVTLYRQLVQKDILAISQSTIRDEAEGGPLGGLFAWTGEKVGFWIRLCEHLGFVQTIARDSHVLLVPHSALILATLRARLDGHRAVSLHMCLHDLEDLFFPCFTRRGTVHRGLAQTLTALHHLGAVRLSHSSDAAQSLLLGERRVSNIEVRS